MISAKIAKTTKNGSTRLAAVPAVAARRGVARLQLLVRRAVEAAPLRMRVDKIISEPADDAWRP